MTSNGAQEYNIAAIRRLLLEAFTPDELRRFCHDRTEFRMVVRRFSPRHSLEDMVDELITYCETRLLFPYLLTEAEKFNPAQFARFEPDLLITEPKKLPAEISAPPTPDTAPVSSGPVKAAAKPLKDEPTPGGGSREEEEPGTSKGKLSHCPLTNS